MSETNALGYPKLAPSDPVPSDIEVSQQIVKEVGLLPVLDVAKQVGLAEDEVIPWGIAKAKISLKARDDRKSQPDGNYVVVTGINPTPLGEGKSTTTVGLAQALGAAVGGVGEPRLDHDALDDLPDARAPQGPEGGVGPLS